MAGEIKTGQIVGEVDRVTGKVRPVVKAELGNNVWSVTLGRGYACGPQPGIQHVLGSQFFPDLLEVGKKEIENEEKMLAEKEAEVTRGRR